MPLKLYRRHRSECEGGHPDGSFSGEFDDGRRGRKRCACLIHCSGTLAGKFNRKQTGTSNWDEAKALAAVWQAAEAWDGKPAPTVPPKTEEETNRVSISDAVTVFLSVRDGEAIAPATLRKYRTFTKQLAAYAESRGYVMLDQFEWGDIDRFYGGLKLGVRAKGKYLGTIRAFFRFCTNRKWLKENPVSLDLKPPQGANKVANKVPFTDEELRNIITACDRLGEIAWVSGIRSGTWNGEDAKDFIWTLTYTGLRISDVALFDMNRLHGNEVFLRAKKNGGEVFAYIPDWLCDRLVARAKRCGERLFILGESDRLDTVTDLWRRKINRVFELAGRFDERPTPHRFRHTFARILLQRGVPVADVADLLGDDEKTVRQHYSRWVPERQARLTRILKEAFEEQPKAKLVALPGGR
jgi:integrase